MLRKSPKLTSVFEKVDNRTVHVQFPKARLSTFFGTHKVGQYMFVNFPALSLQEWHVSSAYLQIIYSIIVEGNVSHYFQYQPFTVASGPNDPYIDIYIRA